MTATRIGGPLETEVPPGGIATIQFQVTPAHSARTEHFQLLVEGTAWLPDTIIEFAMPEPEPVEIPGSPLSIDMTGAAIDLHVVTGESVPWIAQADCDWIVLPVATGAGSGALRLNVLPNWQLGERTGRIRIGRAQVEITQRCSSDDSERVALLCYWKLLGRAPASAEVQPWRGRQNVAAELIETLLFCQEFDNGAELRANSRLLTERLFTAFLEQLPRPGRWRGVIRDTDDTVEPAEIIRRFLALSDVRAMLTPGGSSELPS